MTLIRRRAQDSGMNPTAYAVRKLYGNRKPFGGWADFKHRLSRAGILANPGADVPKVWQEAFAKACGR